MQRLLEIVENAKRLTPQKVRKDLFDFIKTLENELAQYNKSQLYADSQDVEGKAIGTYSKATEVITKGRKKEGQPFDLFETGDFLDGLFAKVQSDHIFFDTKDSKKKEVLKNLLSEDIFGLTEDNLNKVIKEKIAPYFIDYFRKELLK